MNGYTLHLLCTGLRGTMNPNQSAIRGFHLRNHMQSIRGIQFGAGSLENEVAREGTRSDELASYPLIPFGFRPSHLLPYQPTGIRAAIEQHAPQPQQQDARDGNNGPEIVSLLQIS